MDGLPVIIRLIDPPPLHEFLPSMEELLVEVATMRAKGETEGLAEKENLLAVVQGLHESNPPMMGLRGIRLGIVYPPDIMKMQVRAIFEAACDAKLNGIDPPHPEIMIPPDRYRHRVGTGPADPGPNRKRRDGRKGCSG